MSNVVIVDEFNFTQEVIEKSFQVPVLVDFWAEWCAPCKALIPTLTKLADEYQGQLVLAKVNTDEQRNLAAHYNIRSIPTLKLFRHGQLVEETLGVQPESVIRAMIDRHRERPADQLRMQASEAYQHGQANRALALLEKAKGMEPTYYPVQLDIAKILLAERSFEQAEQLLKSLPINVQIEPEVNELLANLNFSKIASKAPSIEILQATLSNHPNDHLSRYQLGAQLVVAGNFEAAMEQFLELMRRHRRFEDDAGRKSLLAVFSLLGNKGELVSRYRNKMSSLLY